MKKKCSKKFHEVNRKTLVPESFFQFFQKRLQRGGFSENFAKFLRISLLQNTYGWLLLPPCRIPRNYFLYYMFSLFWLWSLWFVELFEFSKLLLVSYYSWGFVDRIFSYWAVEKKVELCSLLNIAFVKISNNFSSWGRWRSASRSMCW